MLILIMIIKNECTDPHVFLLLLNSLIFFAAVSINKKKIYIYYIISSEVAKSVHKTLRGKYYYSQ